MHRRAEARAGWKAGALQTSELSRGSVRSSTSSRRACVQLLRGRGRGWGEPPLTYTGWTFASRAGRNNMMSASTKEPEDV